MGRAIRLAVAMVAIVASIGGCSYETTQASSERRIEALEELILTLELSNVDLAEVLSRRGDDLFLEEPNRVSREGSVTGDVTAAMSEVLTELAATGWVVASVECDLEANHYSITGRRDLDGTWANAYVDAFGNEPTSILISFTAPVGDEDEHPSFAERAPVETCLTQ